jgi:adenylate kinase
MNLLLLGPSGVGKGTHAAGLCARYGLRHFSTGDLFRQNLQARTALGLLARRHLNEGTLVPDEIVDAMIEDWADKLPAGEGTLFDGFPRTVDQAAFLDELLRRQQRKLDAAIYLQVDDDVILSRLAGRVICQTCQAPYHLATRPPRQPGRCDRCGGEVKPRSDDAPEMARARLALFRRVTEPLLASFAQQGRLLVVSGAGTIDEVATRLDTAIAALQRGAAGFVRPPDLGHALPAAPRRLEIAAPPTDLNFVLVGGPGSGKGTQAERLSATLRVPHIATGDLFRENLRQATPLGTLARTFMDRGELVPDDVTEAMVEERLARPDAQAGFVLDGFPRTLPQAEALTDILQRLGRRLTGVISINVSAAAIMNRLSGRWICRECQAPYHEKFKPPHTPGRCDACNGVLIQRADDNPTTIAARLVTFHRQTEPLMDYYRRTGLLGEVNGEEAVDRVTTATLAEVRRRAPLPVANP